jgi:tRNA-binding protein
MEKDSSVDSPIDFEIFGQVDVRVGEIRSVERTEGTRAPSYKLVIDFGSEIGTKVSVAQATSYPPEALRGTQVLAVVNLKPRRIGKYVSEVLTLGVPTEDRGTALVVPGMKAIVGGRLF